MNRWRGVLTAVAAGLALLLGPISPASAHDVVLDSSVPAAGSVVVSMESIELRFTGRVNPKFAVFTLTSADGATYELGEARFSNRSMAAEIAPVETLPEGRYRIGFQVLLSDGDPGVGAVEFELSADGTPRAEPWPAASAATAEVDQPGEPDRQTSPTAEASRSSSPSVTSWLVGGLVVTGVIGAGVIVHSRRATVARGDRP